MPRLKIKLLNSATVLSLCISCAAKTSNAGQATDLELIAAESTTNTLALVSLTSSTPGALAAGAWTGSINSSGWSLSFSGSLQGTSLTLTETSTLDTVNQQLTLTDTGFLGSNAINGSGTIGLDAVNWTQTLTRATVAGSIAGLYGLTAGPAGGGLAFFAAFDAVVADDLIQDYFKSTGSLSSNNDPNNPINNISTNISTSETQDSSLPYDASYSGYVLPVPGAVSISSLPEPSSLILTSISATFGLGYWGIRSRASAAHG
jgi:hypothetical protein